MHEYTGKNPYMDYRNTVPFIDLSNFITTQPCYIDNIPAKSLQEYLLKRRLSSMINLKRLIYKKRVEEYKNGRM